MGISIQGRTGWTSVPHTIARSRLPHPTVHLLLNLLTHAEGFNATYATLTEQTGMSSKTIAAALDNLKRLGLVTVTKRKGTAGRFDANHYTFHADLLWRITPEAVDEKLRGKATVPSKDGDGDRCTRESGAAVGGKAGPLYEGKTKKYQGETSRENDQPPLTPQGADGASAAEEGEQAQPSLLPETTTPATPSLTDEFDTWWQQVPRKKAKADARKAFKAARKKATLQQLVDGLEASMRQWQAEGRDVSKIPYPATWLRAESWLDEHDQWQAPQQQRRMWPEELYLRDMQARTPTTDDHSQPWLNGPDTTPPWADTPTAEQPWLGTADEQKGISR